MYCITISPIPSTKLRAALFLIKRPFLTKPTRIIISLYTPLLRSHIEYAIHTCPYLIKNADHLECIQLLATHIVKVCWALPCEERLEKLSLFLLPRRNVKSMKYAKNKPVTDTTSYLVVAVVYKKQQAPVGARSQKLNTKNGPEAAKVQTSKSKR